MCPFNTHICIVFAIVNHCPAPLNAHFRKVARDYFSKLDEFILNFPEKLLEEGYSLYSGMDIGRNHNVSELFIVCAHPGQDARKVYLVGMFTLRIMPFDEQKEVIEKLKGKLPIERLFIDRTGLGEDIAEWATKKYGSHDLTGVHFNLKTKAELASGLKFAFERRDFSLPANRDLQAQLYSALLEMLGNFNTTRRIRLAIMQISFGHWHCLILL